MSDGVNPTSMAVMDMLMLLNGTPSGVVIDERRLRVDKTRGGLFFTKGSKYNLIAYIGWLAKQRHLPKEEKTAKDYEDHKADAAERSRKKSAAGRDIGKIPAIKDEKTRELCRRDFKLFCETYFPLSFPLEWSQDHLDAIEKIQKAGLEGGQFALAMPRGSGKTTLCTVACIWVLVYGHQRYAALVAATDPGAEQIMDSIKSEFENNLKLGQDFPECCFPISKIDGKSQLANGQTTEGLRTKIRWGRKEVHLPTVNGSPSSGSIIKTTGITGHIRGYLKKLKSGEPLRPGFVIIDDPQTDESARSISQNMARLKLLNGAILGLAGPGKKIAAVMPCTVIEEGDMIDQILDHSQFPNWNGQRTKMVLSFPTDKELWQQYENIYEESFERFGDIRLATEFYKKNQIAMDEGARVSWQARYDEGEISAIQNAMNLLILDEFVFWAEYQNEPKNELAGDFELVTSKGLQKKVNGYKRFEVPFGCTALTAGMDVQGKLLYYSVMAWDEEGNGSVIDYGTFPKQGRAYFTLKDAKKSFMDLIPGGSLEENLTKALEISVPALMDKTYFDTNGNEMTINRMLIDANWHESTDPVYEYVRRAKYGNRLRPSHGRPYPATRAPMSEAPQKKGEKKGLNWVITYPKSAQQIRYVAFDANYWKSWLEDRLRVSMGGRGCFSIFGDNPDRHKMFCDNVVAEYVVPVTANGRTVNQWNEYPDRRDNHWKDTSSLCCIGASISGIKVVGSDKPSSKKKKKEKKNRRSMSEEIAKRNRER